MAKSQKSAELAPTSITVTEYSGLQAAYDHFSRALFGDQPLPVVLITYQRKANSCGYFAPDRFSYRADAKAEHEVALNPDTFLGQTDEQVCQTLVHEMTHVWQHFHGKPSKRGYHNKEWAAKMIGIGLMPSSTGAVGGKITGQRMSDYILPDGRFRLVFAELAATGWKLNLQSAPRMGAVKQPPSKVKFTCPGCGSNMWGKADSQDICGACKQWRTAEIAQAAE